MGAVLLDIAWVGAIAWPALLAIVWWTRWRKRFPRSRSLAMIAIITPIWTLGIWAFLVEPETLVMREVEIVSHNWQAAPIRIGVISDTHSGAPHMSAQRLASIVERMNAQHPDLIVLLGDYAGRHEPAEERSPNARSEVMEAVEILGGLSAPQGVYAVLGNHDWWFDGDQIEAALIAQGIPVLEDASMPVPGSEGAIWIVGLADFASRRGMPSYGAATRGMPDEVSVITITHRPDTIDRIPDQVALMMAGHSHCGQVNLPVFGRLMHASPGSETWPCGVYDVKGKKLYVSGGVGTSIFPVRFRQPPEIAIVTLRGYTDDPPPLHDENR